MDYQSVSKKIVTFLRDELKTSRLDGYVFGLSGGIDSSVVASSLSKAGREKTFALVMPSNSTPKQDVNDAANLAKELNLECHIVDITHIHSTILEGLPFDKWAAGNLLARMRMCMLYYYANQRNSLVVGTSDRSELLIGYFTKYGDGGADILPIASLYKTQVRALGHYLKLPETILTKKSGPMLWETNHTAESEIGMSYDEIDSILYCTFDRRMPPKSISEEIGIPMENIMKIKEMHDNSAHKVQMPRICSL